MGYVSKDTIKKLTLLYLVGNFEKGVYGNFKFQKVLYYGIKDTKEHPFTYKRTSDGQFSQDAWDLLDQLHSMGHIVDLREPDRRIWALSNRDSIPLYTDILNRFSDELIEAIKGSIETYGYKNWKELGEIAHNDPLLLETSMNENLFEENLPEQIEINLPEDDCEDLEMSLNSRFVIAMTQLIEGIDRGEISLEQWRTIDS